MDSSDKRFRIIKGGRDDDTPRTLGDEFPVTAESESLSIEPPDEAISIEEALQQIADAPMRVELYVHDAGHALEDSTHETWKTWALLMTLLNAFLIVLLMILWTMLHS